MKILILILSLAVYSCKHNSPDGSSKGKESKTPIAEIENVPAKENVAVSPQNEEVQKPSGEIKRDSTKFRLVIMFYSIGEGTDYQYINAYEDSISAFSQRIKKNIDYQKTAWGREGETDFCLQLSELKDAEKNEFIAYTKMILKKAKWVNIYENYPCLHRKRVK